MCVPADFNRDGLILEPMDHSSVELKHSITTFTQVVRLSGLSSKAVAFGLFPAGVAVCTAQAVSRDSRVGLIFGVGLMCAFWF